MRHEPVLAGRSRRQFLRETVLTGLATVSGLVGVPASEGAASRGERVVVLSQAEPSGDRHHGDMGSVRFLDSDLNPAATERWVPRT